VGVGLEPTRGKTPRLFESRALPLLPTHLFYFLKLSFFQKITSGIIKMMRIAMVGIGGKISTMFAFELAKKAEILGIGEKESVQKILEGKLWVNNEKEFSRLKIKVIEKENFPGEFLPDFLFLGIKNPVKEGVLFYYQKLKEKNIFPPLFLPQNGISATKEAKEALKEIGIENLPIVRMSVFNTVEKIKEGEKEIVQYSLPLSFAFSFSKEFGKKEEIKRLFLDCHFDFEEIEAKKMFEMELSKLFLNLVGMASLSFGFSIKEGFERKDIFKIEMMALKEFVKAVEKNNLSFLNFRTYPVKNLAFLIKILPLSFLTVFRKKIAKKIMENRKGREKQNVEEVNYYNKAVIELAKTVNLSLPYNELIYKKLVGASGFEPETF
jgi:ketopantoate reductase